MNHGEPLLDRHRNTHVFGWSKSLHEMIQYIQGMTLDEKVPLTSTKIYHSWSISPCQIPLKNWQRIRWSELGPGASHISKNPLNMNSYEFLLDSYDMLWLPFSCFFNGHRILVHLALYFGDRLLPQGKSNLTVLKSYLIRKRTKLNLPKQIFEAHIWWWCSLVFFQTLPPKPES